MSTFERPTIASRHELERLLAEDAPYGDLTTETLGLGAVIGEMSFVARDAMVLALAEDAAALTALAGAQVELHAASGSTLAAGERILTARGPADALLRAWKTAQTLIEIWSGVATAAREIVDAAREVSPEVVVACTRKTAPGTRLFAHAAIKAGGAVAHRLGLSETLLVFPEHLAFIPGTPLAEVAALLARTAPEKKRIIEVTSVDAALEAAEAGFDVVQTEKFAPEQIAALVGRLQLKPLRPVIAAAGGIKASNAAAYAAAGADVLVTSAPYLAPPRDVQVKIALLA
ncbi:MAG TPA: ModD protein [Methylocystis sp.]|nr:ModD protein [Methylocystis sp.]